MPVRVFRCSTSSSQCQLPTVTRKHAKTRLQPSFRDGASYSRSSHTNDTGNNVRSTYRINYDEKVRQKVSGDFFEPNDNDIHFPRGFWCHLAYSPDKIPDWQSKLVTNVANHLCSADMPVRISGKVDGDLASKIRKLAEEGVLAKAEEMERAQQIGNAIPEKRKAERARDSDH